jgi:hypothetical protein
MRHDFVTFYGGWQGITDFRLGINTHEIEMESLLEMVEWIEKGWRNQTPD